MEILREVTGDSQEKDSIRKGWVCPKCNKSVSPDKSECPDCSKKQIEESISGNKQVLLG